MIASYIGAARNVYAIARNLVPGAGVGMVDTWTVNVEGAQGELAVAKLLDIYWCPRIGDTKADDVGPYQVRTNCSRKWTDTVLRPKDRDDRIFIGVLALDPPEFEIMGWIWAHEAKQEQWLSNGAEGRPKCWFVPRPALKPMERLPTVAQLIAEAAE